MSYLKKYGSKKRRFQGGGMAPAGPGMEPGMEPGAPASAPGGGGGGEDQIMALAQATVAGDPNAAQELGKLVAPMILQEMQGGGGAPAGPAPEGQPVFRRGGAFAGKR